MPMIDRLKQMGRLIACLSVPLALAAGGDAWAQAEPTASGSGSESPFAGPEDRPKPPEAPVPVRMPAPAPAEPRDVGHATEPAPPVSLGRVESRARAVPDSEMPKGYSAKGFALEAMTSSFASGGLGSLLVGYKGRQVTVGGNVGFEKRTIASTAFGSEDLFAVRFGPGVRVVALHSDDERAELYLHGDMGVIIVNATVPAVENRSDGTATSAAFQLNVGAGVRYWVCPNLAIGYVAMLKYTSSLNQASDVIVLEVPASMGTPGWFLDGSFVLASAF